jgi:hypothetical protein
MALLTSDPEFHPTTRGWEPRNYPPASRAGNSFFFIAVLILSLISAFDIPAKTNFVLK